MKKTIITLFLIGLILITSCTNEIDSDKSKEYNKCTAICASVLSEDFITLELCRQECNKKFLEET